MHLPLQQPGSEGKGAGKGEADCFSVLLYNTEPCPTCNMQSVWHSRWSLHQLVFLLKSTISPNDN